MSVVRNHLSFVLTIMRNIPIYTETLFTINISKAKLIFNAHVIQIQKLKGVIFP